ncbi:hypothetical protein D3C75_1250700 [compost metagenome]
MEWIGLLPYHADLLAKLDYIRTRLVQVIAIHPDMAFCARAGDLIIHPIQRTKERRFTAT